MQNMIKRKIKWIPVARRGKNHALLYVDGVGLGIKKNYAKIIYGIDYKIKNYRQFNGARHLGEDDYQNLINLLSKIHKKKPDYFYFYGQRMEKIANKIIEKTNKLRKKKWEKLTNRELAKILEEMTDLQSKLWGGGIPYAYYFFFNDIFIRDFINKLKDKYKKNLNEIIEFISKPEKITMVGKERLNLLRIANDCIKNKKILKKRLFDHLKKYAFVNKYYFWGEGYTFQEIEKRVKEIIKQGQEYIKNEIKKIKTKKINLAIYGFSNYEKKIIKAMKKASYAMNFANEATNYYIYHLKGLFDEIAKRLKISYEGVVSLRLSEIISSLEKNKLVIPRKEVQKRIKDHAIIFSNGESEVLSGKELKKYYQEEKIKEISVPITELRGMVACPGGIIKGKVHILKETKEVSKFLKGEILVTPMTNPTFVPAMQKAAAIITDEGGFLSHTAIVSRELNIPCIIGTKIATKVLKDGDLVEVDANKGVIRKIK